MSVYEANYDLISIGAYKKGTNPLIDEAIEKITRINSFLTQKTEDSFEYDETVRMLKEAVE